MGSRSDKLGAATNGRGEQCMQTPPWLFRAIAKHWGPFHLDAAAESWNTHCDEYCSLRGGRGNGLATSWAGTVKPWRVFCNPPWRDAGLWAEKAITEIHGEGGPDKIVMLLPARVETVWFRKLAGAAEGTHIIYPRVNYIHPESGEIENGINITSCVFVLERGVVPTANPLIQYIHFNRRDWA